MLSTHDVVRLGMVDVVGFETDLLRALLRLEFEAVEKVGASGVRGVFEKLYNDVMGTAGDLYGLNGGGVNLMDFLRWALAMIERIKIEYDTFIPEKVATFMLASILAKNLEGMTGKGYQVKHDMGNHNIITLRKNDVSVSIHVSVELKNKSFLTQNT